MRAQIMGAWTHDTATGRFQWETHRAGGYSVCRETINDFIRWRVRHNGCSLGTATFPDGRCGADGNGTFADLEMALLAAEEDARDTIERRLAEARDLIVALEAEYALLLGVRSVQLIGQAAS